MRASAPDYKGKFAFMLHLFGIFRENHGLFRADDGSRGLEKDQRLSGHFVAKFGGVRRIVSADANNLGRLDWSEKAHIGKARRGCAARPFAPRRSGDFDHAFTLDQAVAWRWWRSSIARNIAANFHPVSALAVPGLR